MCDWYIIIIVSTLLDRVIINKKSIYINLHIKVVLI